VLLVFECTGFEDESALATSRSWPGHADGRRPNYLDIAPAAELTDRDRIRRHPAFRIQRVPTPSPSPVLLQV